MSSNHSSSSTINALSIPNSPKYSSINSPIPRLLSNHQTRLGKLGFIKGKSDKSLIVRVPGANTTSIGFHDLPEDVINEILLRLPVKSLLKAKSVCKYWYSLIKSPNFITNQMNQRPTNLLVHHFNEITGQSVFSLFPDETLAGDPHIHQNLDYPDKSSEYFYSVYGPIDGLFLLQHGQEPSSCSVALWNPATRESRTLPLANTNLPRGSYCTFGFGWDPLTDDYKVICIQDIWDVETGCYYDPVVALYKLSNDSWKYLNPDIPSICDRRNCIYSSNSYLNGAYYWLSRNCETSFKILSFDMGTDEFREIEAPEEFINKNDIEPKELMLHKNSIALLCFTSDYISGNLGPINLWVMEQDGGWTKHLTIEPLTETLWPLGFWNSDELFLESRTCLESSTSQLVLYNLNTHGKRNLGIQSHQRDTGNYVFWVFRYKESLVSFKC